MPAVSTNSSKVARASLEQDGLSRPRENIASNEGGTSRSLFGLLTRDDEARSLSFLRSCGMKMPFHVSPGEGKIFDDGYSVARVYTLPSCTHRICADVISPWPREKG
jgi:hypothetical protein